MPYTPSLRRAALTVALVATAAPALAGNNPLTQAAAKFQARDLSPQDTQFMELAAQGGETEMADATIALENAGSPKVKAFARKMLADHTEADGKLAGIAKAKGFMLPSDIGSENKAVKGKLQHLHGAAFDSTYLAAQATAHAKMAAVYAKESASGKDPDVVAFAKQTLPDVRAHLALDRTYRSRTAGSR